MAGEDGKPWPREQEAQEYLDKHRVLELFNNMTSELVYHRPDEPKQFLIEMLEKLKKARTTRLDYPCLFDDSNIQSVFGMLDPTGRRFITLQQYKEAMLTLGITKFDEHPAGAEHNKITQDTFNREAKQGLTKSWATFSTDKRR